MSAGDVSSLGKTKDEKTKAKLRQAENMLSAARTVLPQLGIHEEIHNCNKLVIALAKFDVAMVRYVTGKLAETKVKLNSFKDVGCIYLVALLEAFPHADLSPLKAQWGITGETTEQPETEAQAGPLLRLYDVDDTGRTVDPLAVLRSKGFDIGAVVTAIAGENLVASGRSSLLRVAAVQTAGGQAQVTLTLYDLGFVGSKAASAREQCGESVPLVVPFATFFEEWAIADPKTFVEEHAGWPAHRTIITDTARSLCNKGTILFALGSLAALVDKSFDVLALTIYTKPVKKVVSKRFFAVGTLVLLPESTSLKTFKMDERPEDGAGVEVKLQGSTVAATELYYLMPSTAEQNVAPLWFVAPTEDVAKANVVWIEARMSGLCGVDFLGEVSPELKTRHLKKTKKMSPEEAAVAEEDVATLQVSIPVLVNTLPIEVGTELVVHRQRKAEKKKKDPEAITVTSLAKRSKQ